MVGPQSTLLGSAGSLCPRIPPVSRVGHCDVQANGYAIESSERGERQFLAIYFIAIGSG